MKRRASWWIGVWLVGAAWAARAAAGPPASPMAPDARTGEDGSAAPDLPAILRRTIENTARDREAEECFKARYAFTRTKVTETRDGKGRLKKRSEERWANPSPAGNGSSEDRASGQEEEADRPEAKRPYERHDFRVDAAILERFRFTYVGVGAVEGRPVWVVDFEPASERLPSASLKDRFINLTAGRVWIDQEDVTLAKATFRLVEPVNVVGGLVGALKQCAIAMERGRTEEGLWYSRLLTWQIEGRKFFSTRRMEHRAEIQEVRPRLGLESP